MSRDPQILGEVKRTLALLESKAPGRAIEVRIPPYAAIQCGEGPTHTRGTPSNVIEMDADTWLALAAGTTTWRQNFRRAASKPQEAEPISLRTCLYITRNSP